MRSPSSCGSSSGLAGKPRLVVIGPLPPPINGQSVATCRMVSRLQTDFPQVHVTDTSIFMAGDRFRISKIWTSVVPLRAILSADAVYVAVKAGKGMWLTSATAAVARLAGSALFLHHHSHAYIRKRKLRMIVLARIAGSRAQHIVLCRKMATDLLETMPEVKETLVIGNAWLVDRELSSMPLKTCRDGLVLGHLSNLTASKGIEQVVRLATALSRERVKFRLIIGGPASDEVSQRQLELAKRELGDLLEYRGPIGGEDKMRFFSEITHFIFPTSYVHEAVPLVLYEAMASGVVCVSTRQGYIPDQLKGSASILAETAGSFVQEALPALLNTHTSQATSRASRQAFLAALSDSERQLQHFVSTLSVGS